VSSKVIPGWTEILQQMKVGDKWEVYIPPHLAYGSRGAPPSIGPNSVLVFTVFQIFRASTSRYTAYVVIFVML
jgi:FKBP-type peptidyl-prolyl cis-trans isomerase